MAHAAFVRSPYLHAILKSLDKAAALKIEGVLAVYDFTDIRPHMLQDKLPVEFPPRGPNAENALTCRLSQGRGNVFRRMCGNCLSRNAPRRGRTLPHQSKQNGNSSPQQEIAKLLENGAPTAYRDATTNLMMKWSKSTAKSTKFLRLRPLL